MLCKKCDKNEVPQSAINRRHYVCSSCERTTRNNPIKKALCKKCGINNVPPSRLKVYNYTCSVCAKKKHKSKITNENNTTICKHCNLNPVPLSRAKNSNYICNKCSVKKYGDDNYRSQKMRNEIIAKFGNCCNYCKSTDSLQVDHKNGDGKNDRSTLTARRKWFKKILNGDESNCQILCRTCNIAKQNMTDNEFKQWIKNMYDKFYP